MTDLNMHFPYVEWGYTHMNWRFTPLHGKRPIRDKWPSLDLPLDVLREHAKNPGYKGNIGLMTGKASGVIVVDIDREGADAGYDFPPTVEVKTGRGRHLYYQYDGDLRNSASKIADGIDIRGDGGQVVYPGSIHETGTRYEWITPPWSRQSAPSILAELPAWVALAVNQKMQVTPENVGEIKAATTGEPADATEVHSIGRYVQGALNCECENVERCQPGARNDTLYKAAYSLGRLVGAGHLTNDVVERRLITAAMSCGLEPKETVLAIRSGLSRGMSDPKHLKERFGGYTSEEYAEEDKEPDQLKSENNAAKVLSIGTHINDKNECIEIGDDQFVDDVYASIPDGMFYRRDESVIGEVCGSSGEMLFRHISPHRLRYIISKHVKIYEWSGRKLKDGYERFLKYKPWNNDLASLCIENGKAHHRVRNLRMITNFPVFDSSWRLVQPGYNANSGIYYDQPIELADFEPLRDVEEIDRIYMELITDFPFQSQADKENFLGLLITPIIAYAVGGNRPMHLITASLERTGKSKLADVFAGIITGRKMPTMQLRASGQDQENDKCFGAELLSGSTVMCIDNIPSKIDSPSLASLLTSGVYSTRFLGKSEMIKLPNWITIVATGNNTNCSGEISKRIVPIVLQPKDDHPEKRVEFTHPDLDGWVKANRKRLLECLVGMTMNWLDAGFPTVSKPKGGFEGWAKAVGGILYTNMFVNWRDNEEGWQGESNDDGDERGAFVTAWWERFGAKWASCAELTDKLSNDPCVADLLRNTHSDAGARKRIGQYINKMRDMPVLDWIVRIKGHTSANRYYSLQRYRKIYYKDDE